MAQKTTFTVANLFQLRRGAVRIDYAASDFGGQPNLTLTEGDATRTFRGREIQLESVVLGTLVTVTLAAVADGDSQRLSVLLPEVNVGPKNRERIRAVVIRTTSRSSIGGPALVLGALQIYATAQIFRGTASFVVS